MISNMASEDSAVSIRIARGVIRTWTCTIRLPTNLVSCGIYGFPNGACPVQRCLAAQNATSIVFLDIDAVCLLHGRFCCVALMLLLFLVLVSPCRVGRTFVPFLLLLAFLQRPSLTKTSYGYVLCLAEEIRLFHPSFPIRSRSIVASTG